MPQSPASLRFDRRVYIELSFDSRQLKAVRRYIRLNAARAIWKRDHPDRFRCFANVRHAVLDPARQWLAIGNLTLLASPFLFHVRLTLKKTVAEHEAAICAILSGVLLAFMVFLHGEGIYYTIIPPSGARGVARFEGMGNVTTA